LITVHPSKLLAELLLVVLITSMLGAGQVSARCPNGYHKSPLGTCEKYIPHKPYSLPRCDDGYHRSPSGICEPVNGNVKKTKSKTSDVTGNNGKLKTGSKSCPKDSHKSKKGKCVPNETKKNKIISNKLAIPNSTAINNKCQGLADCFSGKVTEVVDGDTLDVNNIRIRLALVNTPEVYENGYFQARSFVMSNCGVGTNASVDEDDGQKSGSFGRMIALVYCGNNTSSLNEDLLNSSLASILQQYCPLSEFSSSHWAVKYGC
jgi:hypothetical protein